MNEWRLNYINGKPFPETRMFDGVHHYRIAAECNGYVLGVTEKGNCAVWSGGYHANGELREVSGGSYFTGVEFGSNPEKCFESAFALFAERASGGKVASVEETRLDVLKGMNENIDSVELDWNETLIEQGSKELGKTIRSVDYEHPSVSDFANRTEIKTYYEHDGNYFVVTQETDDLADVHSSSCESITFDDMINAFVDAKEYGDNFDEERGILHDSVSCHIFDEQLKDDVKQVYENSKLEQVAEKKNWIDLLDSDVRERLATCSSTRDDILPLTKTLWNCNLKNSGKDYSVEDALVSVLRLVDEGGRYFDLTSDERDSILYEVGGITQDKELDLTRESEHRRR